VNREVTGTSGVRTCLGDGVVIPQRTRSDDATKERRPSRLSRSLATARKNYSHLRPRAADEPDMCGARVKFDRIARVSSAAKILRHVAHRSLCRAASQSLRRYRAVVCKRHAETHDKHPSRRTMIHPTETRGSRPTADGTLTEKTSKRRCDGRAACKTSRGGGGGGGRDAEEEKGVYAPPPAPPLPPPPPPPSFGGFYGRKGCLFLYLRGRILE